MDALGKGHLKVHDGEISTGLQIGGSLIIKSSVTPSQSLQTLLGIGSEQRGSCAMSILSYL